VETGVEQLFEFIKKHGSSFKKKIHRRRIIGPSYFKNLRKLVVFTKEIIKN
jgi:hypothetical protein